jgi:hypothetical protein
MPEEVVPPRVFISYSHNDPLPAAHYHVKAGASMASARPS